MFRALAPALGDIPAALATLDRAVTLAEPEGYIRVFAEDGTAMTSLLRGDRRQGIGGTMSVGSRQPLADPEYSSPAEHTLIEPLSERELDVLRLLGTDLDGPAIARQLIVSDQYLSDSHQEHLRQARCDQPQGSSPPGRRPRAAAASPRPPSLEPAFFARAAGA